MMSVENKRRDVLHISCLLALTLSKVGRTLDWKRLADVFCSSCQLFGVHFMWWGIMYEGIHMDTCLLLLGLH
jgi:hypothetical protein